MCDCTLTQVKYTETSTFSVSLLVGSNVGKALKFVRKFLQMLNVNIITFIFSD